MHKNSFWVALLVSDSLFDGSLFYLLFLLRPLHIVAKRFCHCCLVIDITTLKWNAKMIREKGFIVDG